jgi:hypothetical protein
VTPAGRQLPSEVVQGSHPQTNTWESGKMKLVEEIKLSNGLKLNIFDLSREIAADTIQVEIAVRSDIELKESFFLNRADYELVRKFFGDKITYEYKSKRTFVRTVNRDAVLEELISTFKNNSLHYLETANFAEKLAKARLRDIKKDPYKYRNR